VLDDQLPSFYTYRGVAAHHLQDVDKTEEAFRNGTKAFPNDHRSWINLGETFIHQFKMDEAIDAFSKAWALGEASTPYRLLKAKVIISFTY
jgi:cytochrome c-type biogenesis protein CcmH/NrfG